MKILIIGSPGAGKSTLSRQLIQHYQLPALHLDRLWHATDYSESAREQFHADLAAFMAASDCWLIDGNYAGSLPLRLVQADLVIWLDFPPLLCLYRVLKRSLTTRLTGRKRPDMAEAFQERFDKEYLDFLKFVWHFPRQTKPRLLEVLEQFDGQLLVLKKPADCRLESLLPRLESV